MATTEEASSQAGWKWLYVSGAAAAIISEVVLIIGLGAYPFYPFAPGRLSTESIFVLIQKDALGGLISLDFHLLLGNLFGILLFLALYAALKPVNKSLALIALVLGLFADVLIIPARPIAELFMLSGLYAGAATEAARSQYLAAGEALLAAFNGTGWMVNTLLGGVSLLISSLMMLRSPLFSKASGYVGVVTNLAVCLFFIPKLGTLFLLLSLPGYMVWYFLLARRFMRMGRGG